MVHMGSMHGGHYFAYINPTGKQWYKFDDEKVMKVDERVAIEQQFGSSDSLGRGGISRGSNAYMLVYVRESDWPKVFCEASERDLPEHLQAMLRGQLDRETQESVEREEAHLFTSVSVVTPEEVASHVGEKAFGLVAEERARGGPRRVRSTAKFIDVMREIEAATGVPGAQHRYWRCLSDAKHRERGTRPREIIPPSHYDKSVGELSTPVDPVHGRAATTNTALTVFVEVDARPLPGDGATLVFVKWFDPATGQLSLHSHELLPRGSTLALVEETVLQARGLADGTRLAMWEEAGEPGGMHRGPPPGVDDLVVGLKGTERLENAQIGNGDVLILQPRGEGKPAKDAGGGVRAFVERKINQVTVSFQKLDDPRDPGLRIDLMQTDDYRAVAEALAARLGLPSWEHLRLTQKYLWTKKPVKSPLTSGETKSLKQLFLGQMEAHFFFYEVLDKPLSQVEQMRSVRLVYVNPRGEFEKDVVVSCFQDEPMGAVVREAGEQLGVHPSELRIAAVNKHMIHHLMRPETKVNELRLAQWEYRVERQPADEAADALAARGEFLINVSHCVRAGGRPDLDFWGEPLLVPVSPQDTLDTVRARALAKMGLPADDPAALEWKWYLYQMGKAEELAPGTPLGERFKRSRVAEQDLSDMALAVEHPDTRPLSKRRENNRAGFFARPDGGIRIG